MSPSERPTTTLAYDRFNRCQDLLVTNTLAKCPGIIVLFITERWVGNGPAGPQRAGVSGRGRMEPPMMLRSYVTGSWTSPSAEGAPLLDAVTGEEGATISSAGIDMR